MMKNTKVYNISFSAPRFVDSKGTKIIEEKIGKGNIVRFWNARNLVPSIMLGSLNSKHVGIDIPLEDRFSHEWYKPILTHYSLCNVIGTSLKKVLRKSDMKISKK